MKGILGFMFLLMPLILLVAWLWLTRLLWRGGRRFLESPFANRAVRLGLVVVAAVLWFGGSFWEAGGKKIYWDTKVRELCAKDGGVKVHETVELPGELYDQYAKRNWVLPDKAGAKSTDEYYVEREVFYYHKDDPQVTRSQTRIVQRSDGKVLGEYIDYGRGGGDLPGPWHGSSFSCSDIKRPSNIETSIFIKGETNEHDK